MEQIRQATSADLGRIAEIYVFNYRLNFYPLFLDDGFYFRELQVTTLMEQFRENVDQMWVYDDGAVKGFLQAEKGELRKLFVEPALQGNAIGARLLRHALCHLGVHTLWALEANEKAIRFYSRHGFRRTEDRILEEGTTAYLVRLELDETVARVLRMEEIFDRLRASPDPELQRELLSYYEGGQWLLDYEADQRGQLPRDLKRGVLSQDGIWNLLEAQRE